MAPEQALQELMDGNQRFREGFTWRGLRSAWQDREEMLDNQRPFAAILGCADSRVPAEIIFDQGLGDLFVVRIAGNIAAPSQIGSLEYAVDELDVQLIVVLGHSHCGAVGTALDHRWNKSGMLSPNLKAIVDRVNPAVEKTLAWCDTSDRRKLVAATVEENVYHATRQIRSDSGLIREMEQAGQVVLVPAYYELASGTVRLLQGLDD